MVDVVVDVVVDEEMELVVGVMAFVYDPYRMICFLTLLWNCKICIFISSTLSIRALKDTVNTYIYYTYTHKIEWVLFLPDFTMNVVSNSPTHRIGNQ